MSDEKTCKICGKRFTRRNYMQKHMENIHSKRYTCPYCFRLFSGPIEHSCAVENGRYACYVQNCSLRFSNGMAMRLHIRDCHRKINEDVIGEFTKTKKGVRELVQTLCQKINLLNNCFDELKYQVDTIVDFLKHTNLGFDSELIEQITQPNRHNVKQKNQIIKQNNVPHYRDDISTFEDISLDDDILFEDFDDRTASKRGTVICKQIPLTEPLIPLSRESNSSLNTNLKNIIQKNTSDLVIPIESTQRKLSLIEQQRSMRLIPINSSTKQESGMHKTRLQNQSQICKVISQKHYSQPAKSITTSTISKATKQLPKQNLTNNSSVITTNVTEKTSYLTPNSSSTPPLFLNIQYDTQTPVYESDPKIIFHFDTKPPDKNQNITLK